MEPSKETLASWSFVFRDKSSTWKAFLIANQSLKHIVEKGLHCQVLLASNIHLSFIHAVWEKKFCQLSKLCLWQGPIITVIVSDPEAHISKMNKRTGKNEEGSYRKKSDKSLKFYYVPLWGHTSTFRFYLVNCIPHSHILFFFRFFTLSHGGFTLLSIFLLLIFWQDFFCFHRFIQNTHKKRFLARFKSTIKNCWQSLFFHRKY